MILCETPQGTPFILAGHDVRNKMFFLHTGEKKHVALNVGLWYHVFKFEKHEAWRNMTQTGTIICVAHVGNDH